MRTCEHCGIWRRAGTRSPSIWELGGDIRFWKSFKRWKTRRDGRYDERWDHGGQAILRCWWPIRRKLEKCWDGRPDAASETSSPLRGAGCKRRGVWWWIGVKGTCPQRLKPHSKQCMYRSGEPLCPSTPKPGVLGTPALRHPKAKSKAHKRCAT